MKNENVEEMANLSYDKATKIVELLPQTNSLMESYLGYARAFIDDEGIYPLPAMLEDEEGKITMMSLDLSPSEAYQTVFKMAAKENSNQFCMGLDRMSKPGQGIPEKYESVFTAFNLQKGSTLPTVAVFGYNSKKDIGEIDFNNKFWNDKINEEITQLMNGQMKQ